MKLLRRYWFIVLIPALLGACAKPPTAEMNAAYEAVTRAENDADAVAYAPEILVRARETLSKMQEEADSKRYDSVKTYAAEAISIAERAVSAGKAGSEQAKNEAERLVESLALPLKDTETALGNARQVDGLNLDLEALSGELEEARSGAGEAESDLAEGNYRDAAAKGEEARSALSDINARLSSGVQSAARKK